MSAEVDALVRALRWSEACDRALAEGDRVRAFEIAVESRASAQIAAVAAALLDEDDTRAVAVAVRRGDRVAEAAVHARFGRASEAGQAYEDGGELRRAASVHREAGRMAEAGRCLEAHRRDHPDDVEAAVELADLCLSLGRAEAALRALVGLGGEAIEATRRRARAALEGNAAPIQPSGWLFGRYEVVREVATTATSRVLEAVDRLEPGAPRVALKVFVGGGQAGAGRDALVRFEREVQIAGLLDAPSVLRPRALLEDGPTLVLPWMGGGSLDALAEKGPLPARRVAEIADRVLAALAAAHRRGIVHRDVKPSNVLLDEIGGAYLTDFGVAHLGDAGATATAGVLGTVRYMAPEQRLGEPASPESDVYAVGVVLRELLGVEEAWPAPVRALLDRLTAECREDRPTADDARAALAAVSWPDEPFSTRRAPSLRPITAAGRFVDEGPGLRDTLLDRLERLVPLDHPAVAALLTADDPAVPRLLGRRGDLARIEAPSGPRRPAADGPTPVVARLAALGVTVTGWVETSRGWVAELDLSRR